LSLKIQFSSKDLFTIIEKIRYEVEKEIFSNNNLFSILLPNDNHEKNEQLDSLLNEFKDIIEWFFFFFYLKGKFFLKL
jgi:hypothetical protein